MEIYEKLSEWYEIVKRELPWRETSDPYYIWISEIILQQTRVAQGTDYYNRFILKFPDIFSLANADIDDVLKLWQGLGYYTRARNLHFTAKFLVNERKGKFPGSFSELLKLKGVGEYTAAAISSIAFHEPKAAVDGNVKRVISRLFSIEQEINSSEGVKLIQSLATEILDKNHPGRHNQAMMELGAKICLPQKPLCPECPVNNNCMALSASKVSEFPVKYKKAKAKDRFFTYIIIRKKDSIFLHQRTENDIWNGLYEFPLIETDRLIEINEYPALLEKFFKSAKSGFLINKVSDTVSHKLSHRNLICRFVHIYLDEGSGFPSFPGKNVEIRNFPDYPVPKLIERYISNSGF